MKCLDIPDDFADISAWLDDVVASPDLVDTILQLEIIAGDQLTDDQSLDDIFDSQYQQIFDGGLAAAEESAIRNLLRQPTLLLELQEQVLMHGGDFWQSKIKASFNLPETPGSLKRSHANAASNPGSPKVSVSPKSPWQSTGRALGLVAALAATILFAVMIFPAGNQVANNDPADPPNVQDDGGDKINDAPKVGWGFAASGLLDAPIDEKQMLTKLSEASLAWYNQVPSTNNELTDRLAQFDLGCQELLAADLPQLSDANRQMVRKACENCRAAIAKHLTDIQDGADFDAALLNADNTINRLSDAIRNLI